MVKIIKLQNNAEIIGTVAHETNNEVIVDNPFTINYMFSSSNDRPIIGLLRYMPFADKRQIAFSKEHVLHIMDARVSMSSYYTSTLETYINEVDESIDDELDTIVKLDSLEQESSADMLAAMLEKLNPNNKMH
jgi:hypothetical protein